jgi:hypothetical protein
LRQIRRHASRCEQVWRRATPAAVAAASADQTSSARPSARSTRFADVGVAPRLVGTEMRAAILQARIVAACCEAGRRQRALRSIPWRANASPAVPNRSSRARAQRRQQRVEQRQHLDRVVAAVGCGRRRLPAVIFEARAIVERIEQTDDDEGDQQRRRRHPRPAATDPLPGRAQQRIARRQPAEHDAPSSSSQISTSDQRMTGRKDIS